MKYILTGKKKDCSAYVTQLIFLQMSSDQNGELKTEKAEETPLNVDTDMEDAGEEDLRYGWGNIRPKCLQLLNSPKCFVTALAFFSFIQGNSTDIIQSGLATT